MKSTDNGNLSDLLRKWETIEASSDFETAVWRRIHAEPVPESSATRPVGVLRDWLLLNAGWVNAAAAMLGIALGVWVELLPHLRAHSQLADEPLLHSRTLAGSYLAMTGGGTR